MKCAFCGNDSLYRCATCGRVLCAEHLSLRAVCDSCVKKRRLRHNLYKVKTAPERRTIRDFVRRFWGEQEQVCFDKKFVVAELPAYVDKVNREIAGFAAYSIENQAVIIVALGVLPEFQGAGIGRSLTKKVEAEARKLGKDVLVSTSNDDLPALAFYQELGFQLYEVKPDVVAEKHGAVLKGIGGLPVRDELRLRKRPA